LTPQSFNCMGQAMDFAILFVQMYFMEISQYFQSLEFADGNL